jgi:hypothetical protein
MAFIHGKQGSVLIGSTSVNVIDFEVTLEVDLADITHSGAGGYQVMLPGISKASGKLSFIYDTANRPTQSPLSMVPGLAATVHLKPDGVDDFSFPAYLKNLKFKSGPKSGPVQCDVEFDSTGPITTP